LHELRYKLDRITRYLHPQREMKPIDPDDIPGLNPEIWEPIETSPKPIQDERLIAHRGAMVEARKRSFSNPGLYVDNSPTGSGKTTADLLAIRNTNKPALILEQNHKACAE